MTLNDVPALCLLAVIVLIAFTVGFLCGGALEMEHQQQLAVEAGVAERRIDEKGAVTFHWLDCGNTPRESEETP